jgi:predicted transposase/invertase (TIGR01784 family)
MDKGGKYADLKEVIFIAITNFVMFPDKNDCVSVHNIRDIKTNEHDFTAFSFAFIELPKYNHREDVSGIDRWCELFKYAREQNSPPPNDLTIQRAYQTLEMTNWSEQELRDYQAYQKILLDSQAREDQVRDEGISIGINIGINKGKLENQHEVALKMLQKNMPLEDIADFTGLAVEEIEKLT